MTYQQSTLTAVIHSESGAGKSQLTCIDCERIKIYSGGRCQSCYRKKLRNDPMRHLAVQAKTKRNNKAAVKRNRRLVDTAKNKPCMDCQKVYPSYVMQFDHRPGTAKLWHVGTMCTARRSITMILAEIAKCDVVCANCHAIRTNLRERLNAN